MEDAITNAITRAIVDPIKTWVKTSAVKGIILTQWGCILVTSLGLFMLVIGYKKGKDYCYKSIMVYIGVTILRSVIGL